jgi:replicative DNA helicase
MNASAILISQLNREIERRDDPVPQMSDFAESGAIEQTAEMAAFVYYPYNVDPEINDKYESKIVIAKARYGKIGRYRIGYNGERCKFYNNVELAKGQDNSW